MGCFATTGWLLFGFVDLVFATVAVGGLGCFEEEAALAGIFEALGVEDGLGFLDQIVEGFEASIDAGEAHVGHLIEAAEALGDQLADDLAGDFLVVVAVDVFFNFIHEAFELFEFDGAFVAGAFEAGEQFLPVEGDSSSIFFNDRQADVFLDAFVGGEALFAMEAEAAAADGPIPFSGARIDHLQVIFVSVTEGTAHRYIVANSARRRKMWGEGMLMST